MTSAKILGDLNFFFKFLKLYELLNTTKINPERKFFIYTHHNNTNIFNISFEYYKQISRKIIFASLSYYDKNFWGKMIFFYEYGTRNMNMKIK